MRKTFLLIFLIFPIALWLSGCGGSSSGLSGTKDQPSISISPNSASILVGQSTQFSANVQNLSDTHVSWTVQEANGGTVATTNTGAIYTAPWPVGMYHVIVKSVADPTLTATAMVSVSAQFAFIQELLTGDALPFSMTPMIGTFDVLANVGISQIIDTSTNKPVSVAMESLTLSNDGKKATFDIETQDTTTSNYYSDIYIANIDASAVTPLTTNGVSWMPQFSSDGKQILYMSAPVNNWESIWLMNADGSNQHEIFSGETNGAYIYSATLSPDGSKIAAELEWAPDGLTQDGIAIMNSDGSSPIQLTGANIGCQGYDEMPAFSNDGTTIMFSRWCAEQNGNESMYTINTNGTGLARLGTAAPDGVYNYNPLPVGDRIVYQSNRDFPNTQGFEIYTMKGDGSALTRLTSNSVYDGFDFNWWSGPTSASAQRTYQSLRAANPALRARAEKIKRFLQHRK